MIDVEHLSKQYGSTTAINDVTFHAEPGEILGLLGPNGAGKTTTMRILSGYLPASDGTARVAGYEVHESPMAVRQLKHGRPLRRYAQSLRPRPDTSGGLRLLE